MGVTLADLDHWDPASIRSVADAAKQRADETRDFAHNIGAIMTRLQWQGQSYEQALFNAQRIGKEMSVHADECDAASKAVGEAASEVESIKSTLQRIYRMADRYGIVINPDNGRLEWYRPADPEDAVEMERRADIVEQELQDLLRQANATDERLSAAVDDAISDMAEAAGLESIEPEDNARITVDDALAGDQNSAAIVKHVLDSITPEQLSGAESLTPIQAAMLSQMQAQQNGMSVEALSTAESRLGDSKGIIADSWQLMSDPDLRFPKTELTSGAVEDFKNMTGGGFGQLPQSVQGVLNSKGTAQFGDMAKVTNIVKDGSAFLRQGTELDRGLLNKATEMMSADDFHRIPTGFDGQVGTTASGTPVVLDVLATAGQDRQAIHDIVNDPAYAERFMRGALINTWCDNGQAVGDMFSWTGAAVDGPDARLAAETASAYGSWVGKLEDELMSLTGFQTLGQVNPEAVQGLAQGLAPYLPDIAGLEDGRHAGFDIPDDGTARTNGTLPIAKGIFSVLSTDQQASDIFNGAAAREIALAQNDYANGVKAGLDPAVHAGNLTESMTLQGLVDSGLHNASAAVGDNDVNAWEAKKSAFEFGLSGLDLAGMPGKDMASLAVDALIGPKPESAAASTNDLPDLNIAAAQSQVLNALNRAGMETGLSEQFLAPPDPANPNAPRRILSFAEYEMKEASSGAISPAEKTYEDAMRAAITTQLGTAVATVDSTMPSRYNSVTNNTDP